jgi:2-polyprenyl-6-methoxyphenol hydroxylase-like FAD-dependent oxidoreductase
MLHRDIDTALPAYAAQRQRHIHFYQSAGAVLTQFFQSNLRLAGLVRDASFPPMARIPWLRTEMIKTLAGLKTGPLSWRGAEKLAGLSTTGTADVLVRS